MVNPCTEAGRKPSVECNIPELEQIVYILAKAGWYGGNPETIKNIPVDTVINSYHFEIYSREYEATCIELNKADK